jgi:hypothetical protein
MVIGKPAFFELKVPEISPSGWLRRQLSIQLKGLTGNLDKFWPDVKDSRWFGGGREGWERAPYWLDGALPLACLLGDAELIGRIEGYLAYIMDNQEPGGWLGPRDMNSQLSSTGSDGKYDIWPQFLMLKVLVQYHDIKEDSRIRDCIGRALRSIDRHINRYPIFNWAQFRWFEALIPILWLHERTREEWLVDLAVKLKAQGFDWKGFFGHWPFRKPTPKNAWNYMSHVVNNAMAVKASALWRRFSGDDEDLLAVDRMISALDEFHGTAVGCFTGDECLAGRSPVQGTELCAVVEYMYSLEEIIRNSGALGYADRLETLAFNALPATFSDDMWSHQYDQQVNQIQCSVGETWPWLTNGPESNIFGLEPNFGCCTANMHQGWPKFAKSLWLRDGNGDLTVVSLAPCEISTRVRGEGVHISVGGEYPFGDSVDISIDNPKAVPFAIHLRVPEWADRMRVSHDGESVQPVSGMVTIAVGAAPGRASERVRIELDPEIRVLKRSGRSASVRRGALVYALPVSPEWKRINETVEGRELPHGDWELRPLSKWNYAISGEGLRAEHSVVGAIPFSADSPPIRIAARGVELENWKEEDGCVGALPEKPRWGAERELELLPYGCAKLRIAEFPLAESLRAESPETEEAP